MKKVHSLKKKILKPLADFIFSFITDILGLMELEPNISLHLTSNGTTLVALGRGSLSVITTFMSFVSIYLMSFSK